MGTFGILTFHRAINYGAALQCYALQQAVLSLDAECEVIDYSSPRVYAANRAPRKTLKSQIGWALVKRQNKARIARFDAFMRDCVHLSVPVNSREELARTADAYDAVIAGSDQVWNPALTDADESYFLDFLPDGTRRRSYAASIGERAFPPEMERHLADLLRGFGNLCVREPGACSYLSRLTGRRVSSACDPTLLLPAEHWARLAVGTDLQGYVLVYSLSRVSDASFTYAKALARSRGLDVVVVQQSPRAVPGAKRVVRDAGPREFLGLVAGADAVVSESFHGCCFALLFERDLHWVPRAETAGREGRITDLLGVCGLDGCRVAEGARPLDAIDWGAVRPALEAYRGESLRILSEEVLELA